MHFQRLEQTNIPLQTVHTVRRVNETGRPRKVEGDVPILGAGTGDSHNLWSDDDDDDYDTKLSLQK
jgi:hypothetical protein